MTRRSAAKARQAAAAQAAQAADALLTWLHTTNGGRATPGGRDQADEGRGRVARWASGGRRGRRHSVCRTGAS
jgi:hypothetical protein